MQNLRDNYCNILRERGDKSYFSNLFPRDNPTILRMIAIRWLSATALHFVRRSSFRRRGTSRERTRWMRSWASLCSHESWQDAGVYGHGALLQSVKWHFLSKTFLLVRYIHSTGTGRWTQHSRQHYGLEH